MNSVVHTATDQRRRGVPELPEPGQIVEVRGATWAVSDVRTQGISRSPADEGRAGEQHEVSLQSLQEDRLGEELSVVWELEVGQTVLPDQGLPTAISDDGFDDPNVLGAFIDAVRWGAVTSADPSAYQAPFRSGANVEPYQLEPLRRALESPRTNLLLADDVGLGKTIEAGLVIEELLLRHRARRVIIVCPPSLALKWQDEMREKFGLEFVIVNSELLSQVRRSHGLAANPLLLFPRVIVSMAWLPGVRAQRLLRGVLADVGKTNSARQYAFDILVVDEAHHVAPSSPSALGGGRGYALDSQRTIATRALAERCEHRLFLSATPHNGYTESFTALLEMIDNRRFSRGATIDSGALRDVTVRRLKTAITDKDFLPREIRSLPFTPAQDEEEEFDKLAELLANSAVAKRGSRSLDIVGLLLKKRFLSSPWAFARTLSGYLDATGSGADYEFEDDAYVEVLGRDQSDEEEGLFEQPEFVALRQSKTPDALSSASRAEIQRLVEWGNGYEYKPNSRLDRLITYLDATCRPDGQWNHNRVVIFTEYADTLAWISRVLSSHGYGDVLEVIQGSTPTEEREIIRARFAEHPVSDPIRVLLATDAAGEGIDLQDHCHLLVNFDVPFDPSRLEQRIGRIDRYGQRETPTVYYFAPDNQASLYAADLEFLKAIAEKHGQTTRDLGSANAIVDDDIQARFLPNTPRRRPRPRNEAEESELNQATAASRELNQQLTRLRDNFVATKDQMHLTPFNARRVIDTALALSAQPLLREEGDERADSPVYQVPALGKLWQSALRGLDTRLAPGQFRPITFDQNDARGRSDLVYVHLGHPLMQKSARILRGSLWGSDSQVHRVTTVVVPELADSCVAAVARLVLVGRGGLRLHEEVFITGVRFKGHDLAEAKAHAILDHALDSPDLKLAPEAIRSHVRREWEANDSRLRGRLQAAVERRAERQQTSVAASLETRRDDDIERAERIFAAFRRNLQDSLAMVRRAQEEQDAMLLPDDQQRQRQRDIAAMEQRLASLADEEAREVESLRARYDDVRPFVSTAALVFAVTPADAEAWAGEAR